MEQTDEAVDTLTVADFLTTTQFKRLSANQQKYAETILTDVLAARETVDLNQGVWTPRQVAGTLAALPSLVDQPHVYYVAVVPVMIAYFEAQGHQVKPLIAALKAARPALVAKHAETAQEEADYDGVVQQVKQWVQAMFEQPEVMNLTIADQHHFVTIIHTTAELMITGRKLAPKDWDVDTLSGIMFGPFTHLLDEKDRVSGLFQLVPFALTTLFTYLEQTNQLTHAAALQDWVLKQHEALVTMYNPELEKFYEGLTEAMEQAGIDTQDHTAVDHFTQTYLRAHPAISRALFTADRQLKRTKPVKQIKYSRKQRRRRRRKH
ncbi:hypothetical protein [Levilactobacillus huananensis]|uniref:hypothetical protein n=1 Tax=Levilactobacillus huananensis TaxID=2486019 RepID=UPI000F798350|nr:hypothetical protein [Levilactobacillus huananensis]